MAAIDSLLKLVEAQKADALIVASERVPLLKKAGADVALSMPRVSHDMVSMFLEDLVDPAQALQLKQEGSVRLSHSVGGQVFSAELRSEGGRHHLAFYLQRGRAGAPAPAAAAAETLRAPVAPPPPRPGPRSEVPAAPASGLSPGTGAARPAGMSAGTGGARPVGVGTAAVRPASAPVEEAPAPAYRQASVNAGDVIELVLQAHRDGASDVLLSSGLAARVRLGGSLQETALVCDGAQIMALAEPGWSPQRQQELEQRGSVDLALDLSPGPGARPLRFRVNVFRQRRGLAASVRPVKAEIPALVQLGLPDDFKSLVQFTSGLVLMTGPTGSGKSTTLAALIEHVNLSTSKHVITIEDPVEFQYVSKRAIIHQRELGSDVDSFASGLRAALREDPDIILLGEMRDEETIAAALTAAETGHLVLSTLHSASAAMAIDRIIDVFPGHKQPQVRLQLAGALRAVITQVLLPTTGLGRLPAFEKMIVTTAVASQIREGRAHQIANQIQTGRNEGMVSLEQSLVALLRTGRVSVEAALAVAPDPEGLRRALRA
jgi:twitching motility protein PilT